jgi:hypothetical protein
MDKQLLTEVESPLQARDRISKVLVCIREGFETVGLPLRAGKGSALHQHLQRLIATYAEQQGCCVKVDTARFLAQGTGEGFQ